MIFRRIKNYNSVVKCCIIVLLVFPYFFHGVARCLSFDWFFLCFHIFKCVNRKSSDENASMYRLPQPFLDNLLDNDNDNSAAP